MADILIRGMEMPKNCIDCMFTTIDYDMCILAKNDLMLCGGRPSWCPILPLPDGHGRLVDAREVLEKADKAPWFDGDVAELGLLIGSEVTTIVPAEGGQTNGETD